MNVPTGEPMSPVIDASLIWVSIKLFCIYPHSDDKEQQH